MRWTLRTVSRPPRSLRNSGPLARSLAMGGPVAGPGGNLQSIGQALYRDFLLPFEIASVLLLVAMIGAIVLARQKY